MDFDKTARGILDEEAGGDFEGEADEDREDEDDNDADGEDDESLISSSSSSLSPPRRDFLPLRLLLSGRSVSFNDSRTPRLRLAPRRVALLREDGKFS